MSVHKRIVQSVVATQLCCCSGCFQGWCNPGYTAALPIQGRIFPRHLHQWRCPLILSDGASDNDIETGIAKHEQQRWRRPLVCATVSLNPLKKHAGTASCSRRLVGKVEVIQPSTSAPIPNSLSIKDVVSIGLICRTCQGCRLRFYASV
jgi:hypothetical protein